MILSQFTALEMTVASYVIAIKRAGMVLSVVFGLLLLQGEDTCERGSQARCS